LVSPDLQKQNPAGHPSPITLISSALLQLEFLTRQPDLLPKHGSLWHHSEKLQWRIPLDEVLLSL
jgi:hypothetical protein